MTLLSADSRTELKDDAMGIDQCPRLRLEPV
jgi:hypothetical protein